MNHNNVISLPIKPATALVAGTIVKMDSDGNCAVPTAANLAVGTVLHDVDAASSGAPVAVQLFSGGGIAVLLSGAAHAVGAIISPHATSGKTAAGVGAANVNSFIAMEASSGADELIRCIIK